MSWLRCQLTKVSIHAWCSSIGYSCFCEDGFTGYHCQTNWNECWSNPCLNEGTCIDGIGTYSCACPPGFSGKYFPASYRVLVACGSDWLMDAAQLTDFVFWNLQFDEGNCTQIFQTCHDSSWSIAAFLSHNLDFPIRSNQIEKCWLIHRHWSMLM